MSISILTDKGTDFCISIFRDGDTNSYCSLKVDSRGNVDHENKYYVIAGIRESRRVCAKHRQKPHGSCRRSTVFWKVRRLFSLSLRVQRWTTFREFIDENPTFRGFPEKIGNYLIKAHQFMTLLTSLVNEMLYPSLLCESHQRVLWRDLIILRCLVAV